MIPIVDLQKAVSRAIQDGLDIMIARPDFADMTVTDIENECEKFIEDINANLLSCLINIRREVLLEMSVRELTAIFLIMGVRLPLTCLRNISQIILSDIRMERMHIADFPDINKKINGKFVLPDGEELSAYKTSSLWYVKMHVECGHEAV